MIKNCMVFIVAIGILFSATLTAQDVVSARVQSSEGMWLPLKIKELNYAQMQEMGCEVPAEEIYNEESASIENAIVKLNGGSCTAEMISSQGLVLTNHHCSYDAIASLSSEDNDLLTDGFWAASLSEELPVEGGSASYLVRSEDVTTKVLGEEGDNPQEMESRINTIIEEATAGTNYTAEVSEMFHGSEYYLFVYETYTDVRLVGAPPSSIGKFGYDTDNWVWPRHTGDFSLLRVYAGPDNKPADYSPDNKPFKPSYHLTISLEGVKEGDFAMVMGYPGSTTRYLTSSAIQLALDQTNSDRIHLMGQKARIMKAAMDQSDAVRIALASEYASLMNTYKYFIGQNTMMKRYDVVGEKKKNEVKFQEWAEATPEHKEKYGLLLNEIDELHKMYKPADKFYNYLILSALASEATGFSFQFTGLKNALNSGDKEAIAGASEQVKAIGEEFFDGFYYDIDKEIFATAFRSFYMDLPEDIRPAIFDELLNPKPVVPEMPEEAVPTRKKKKKKKKKKKSEMANMPPPPPMKELSIDEKIDKWTEMAYSTSILTDKNRFDAFMENPTSEVLEKDPIMEYMGGIISFFRSKIALTYGTFEYQIGSLRQDYVQGLRELYADKNFYPDANSTMRLTYGKVLAYEPRDGVFYDYYTTIDGIMEKEDPDDEEFIVPEKLKTLWKNKDYGRYAENGNLRVCFLTNNDITGGNSGSPVLNGKGQLIGCAFDGNWESMSSDIHVFPQFNRTISVDIRYVLFIMDKYAGAQRLIDELTIAGMEEEKR